MGLNGKVGAVGLMAFKPRFGGQRGAAGEPCKNGRGKGNLALAIDDIRSVFCVRLSKYGRLLLIFSLASVLRSLDFTFSLAAGLLRSSGASSVSSSSSSSALISSSLVSNGLYGTNTDDRGGVGGKMVDEAVMMSFS